MLAKPSGVIAPVDDVWNPEMMCFVSPSAVIESKQKTHSLQDMMAGTPWHESSMIGEADIEYFLTQNKFRAVR